jgi:large subunit ribosomal protein L43
MNTEWRRRSHTLLQKARLPLLRPWRFIQVHLPVNPSLCTFINRRRGMKSFLTHHLPRFARAHPSIEIAISPRPNHHPVIRGHYTNGNAKAICVRSLEPDEVRIMAERLRNTSGEPWKRVLKPVKSVNESVRGVWSGVHGSGISVGDDGLWAGKKKSKKSMKGL